MMCPKRYLRKLVNVQSRTSISISTPPTHFRAPGLLSAIGFIIFLAFGYAPRGSTKWTPATMLFSDDITAPQQTTTAEPQNSIRSSLRVWRMRARLFTNPARLARQLATELDVFDPRCSMFSPQFSKCFLFVGFVYANTWIDYLGRRSSGFNWFFVRVLAMKPIFNQMFFCSLTVFNFSQGWENTIP